MVILLTVINNLTFSSFSESSFGGGSSWNTSCRWKTSGSCSGLQQFFLPVMINLTSSESLSQDRNTHLSSVCVPQLVESRFKSCRTATIGTPSPSFFEGYSNSNCKCESCVEIEDYSIAYFGIASQCLKRHIPELSLRAGLMHASQMHEQLTSL